MEPISKSSLADGVSERLILLLKEGKYRPGDRLPTERQLAEQFGVGRTSVREGLRYLEKMGILDIHQGRGITVRSLSLEDIFAYSVPLTSLIELPNKEIRDTMYARRLLERESVYLACENRTGQELGELRPLARGSAHLLAEHLAAAHPGAGGLKLRHLRLQRLPVRAHPGVAERQGHGRGSDLRA